jgi:acetoin utilization deacetylase AcuC-like enzyme
MVIYSEERRASLEEYGIQIPVRDSRARRAFQQLLADPRLAEREAEWHLHHAGIPVTREDLLRAHSEDYVGRLYSAGLEKEIIRAYELRDEQGRPYRYDPSQATRPLRDLLDRALYNVGGTFQCCTAALKSGFCFFFGGGTHHAHRDYGKGFCLVNDVVVALRKLQAEGTVHTAWVIDVDAHKGDGTAALTAGDETIRTLSVHMARGWPLDEEPRDAAGNLNPSFIPSDIDVPVDSGEERLYNRRLAAALRRLGRLPPPQLAVVVDGADPYQADELPSAQALRLTLEQMGRRDRLIYRFLEERRIPGAYLMSGGYGESSWEVYARFLGWALRRRSG